MTAENPYRDLTRDEMWQLLDDEPFGRLAVQAGGFVDIFPVNFVVHGKKLWFRTAPGSKLAALTVNDQVAFEADHRDEDRLRVSSVVLQGRARRVDDAQERESERHATRRRARTRGPANASSASCTPRPPAWRG